MPEHDLAVAETSTEKFLAEIWKELLGFEAPGIHDGFFEIGGNSLSGALLVSMINRTYCIRMSLQNLFDNSTIAALSREIDRLQYDVIKKDENGLEQLLSDVESNAVDGISPFPRDKAGD